MKPKKQKSKVVVEQPSSETVAIGSASEAESHLSATEAAEGTLTHDSIAMLDTDSAGQKSPKENETGKPIQKRRQIDCLPVEMEIALNLLDLDAKTESRPLREDVAAEYSDQMKDGTVFPPVEVYREGDSCFLADGFHRVAAAKLAGQESIQARVWKGGRVDALKYALAANETHGLRRTVDDKKYAVGRALQEFPNLADRAIAEMCRVSPTFVSGRRKVATDTTVHVDSSAKAVTKRVGRDGKTRRVPKKNKAGKQSQVEQGTSTTHATELNETDEPKASSEGPLVELRERIIGIQNDVDILVARPSGSWPTIRQLLRNHLDWTVDVVDLLEERGEVNPGLPLASSTQTDPV